MRAMKGWDSHGMANVSLEMSLENTPCIACLESTG